MMKYTNKLKSWILFATLIISFVTTPAVAQTNNSAKNTGSNYETGIIHRIDTDEIVISDTLYKFSKDIKFLSRQGAKIETRWFKEGDKVRFVINSKDEVRIIRKT